MNRRVTEIYKTIGKKLSEVRISKNYSQRECGEKVGVSLQQFAKYEKGINRIPVDKLFIMSILLDTNIIVFLA